VAFLRVVVSRGVFFVLDATSWTAGCFIPNVMTQDRNILIARADTALREAQRLRAELDRRNMRLWVGAWLVILTLIGIVFYFIGSPGYRRLMNECSEAGVDRMVEPPSDDDLHRLYLDCRRGRSSR
jgi:hypothetical protein